MLLVNRYENNGLTHLEMESNTVWFKDCILGSHLWLEAAYIEEPILAQIKYRKLQLGTVAHEILVSSIHQLSSNKKSLSFAVLKQNLVNALLKSCALFKDAGVFNSFKAKRKPKFNSSFPLFICYLPGTSQVAAQRNARGSRKEYCGI